MSRRRGKRIHAKHCTPPIYKVVAREVVEPRQALQCIRFGQGNYPHSLDLGTLSKDTPGTSEAPALLPPVLRDRQTVHSVVV